MSSYPKWWNNTITIFNKYEDSTTSEITWYKTVLTGCFFADTFARNMSINQVDNLNALVVRIPKNSNFKPYGEWISLSATERASYFTISLGDIIVNGRITDTIDEYDSTKNSSTLLEKYKKLGNCLTVESYQDNTGAGREIPHYRITGA